MSHQKVTIYYFSGTGNSRNVAAWFAASAKNKNIETTVINIARVDRKKIEPPPENSLVVFISPIHGFNYPPVMLHFIARFPRGRNNVVLMNTRAGMLIGKFITPGLTGAAFWFSSLLLKLKGYSISGLLPVDLPSNWISLHPGLNERTVRYLHEKNQQKIEKFAVGIFEGKRNFKALREIVQDLLISPVSFLYYFFGRFFIAKTFYASADCNNCNFCIQQCSVKGVVEIDRRPFWTFRCESCMQCMNLCPKKAIETGHGFVLGIYLIYLATLPFFYQTFEKWLFKLNSEILQFLIETAILLLMAAVFYRIIHFSMRFKFFERLMVYTSLTRLRFWRRYRALKP